MLPITPSGAGDSPYQSLSAFAGSHLYIHLAELAAAGLVGRKRLRQLAQLGYKRVNYPAVERFKNEVLREAFEAFEARGGESSLAGMAEFAAREQEWLEPWCRYMAIKQEQGLAGWTQWPQGLRDPNSSEVADAARRLDHEVRYQRWLQFLFQSQWDRLRAEAASRGVALIGDLPIFVSLDSADAWGRQDLFNFDRAAGVPPDYFSAEGQMWGNPIYRWDRHRQEDYHWWKQRFRRVLGMFDVVRVDHFIGFHRTWSVPRGASNAKEGVFEAGPGEEFFRPVEAGLGGTLSIIAEDLGVVTAEVEQLRDTMQYPGMKVLQFAFGGGVQSGSEQPHSYRKNLVAYTGTHDNNTSTGWFEDGDGMDKSDPSFRAEREFALEYIHGTRTQVHWDMVRAVQASVANTAIVPIQDLFGLGSEARINRPGTPQGNWDWRLPARLLNRRTAGHLRRLSELYGRI
jgi:4-alpha-glucanotransferase